LSHQGRAAVTDPVFGVDLDVCVCARMCELVIRGNIRTGAIREAHESWKTRFFCDQEVLFCSNKLHWI
jgi:hypothetical protein